MLLPFKCLQETFESIFKVGPKAAEDQTLTMPKYSMRAFLVVSVALIGLFSSQCSLFATLVYRYEVAYQNEIRPQGTGNSGYIDFLTPYGEGLFPEVVYDFRVTSMPSPTYGLDRELGMIPFPVIPSRTYSLSDGIISTFMAIQTINWDGTDIGGDFHIRFHNPEQPHTWLSVSVPNIYNYWPMEYVFNESSMGSQWLFTGTRNVPDSGGTVLILILSGISLGVCRLLTRAPKPACKTG